jgi:DNA-binding CsgD family transcriptional regulator
MLSVRQEIVGRDGEVEALAALVDDVRSNPRQLVIEGEAGIGKTILWRHALACAQTAGVTVLAASPSELETPLAFSGLRDLIDHAYDGVADALPSPQRRALDVALLRADPAADTVDQGAVAAAFLASLRLLADRGPVLLAVDDLQWLDEPTRFLVDFVARRLRREPIALLLSLRAEAGAAELRPGNRDLQRITLPPLSVGALHRIVRTQLGASPSRPTLVRLHALSAGNPFFGLEVARALQRRGWVDEPGSVPLPSRLQDLVGERLSALPPETVQALQYASALAHPTVEVVVRAVGGPEPLDSAVAAEVISTDGDRLRFRHPLLASAAYASAGPGRLRGIHRLLATLVDDPDEQARHLGLAATGPDPEVAAALERAAARARARGASAVAANLAQQAHRMTPSRAAVAGARRLMVAAGSLFDAGDAAGAARLFERAVEAAAPGPARAEALIGLGRAYAFAADLRAAAGVYRRAIAESDPVSRLRAEAEHGLAVALMRLLEDLTTAARHADAAVEIAVELADPETVRELAETQTLIHRLLGEKAPEPETTLVENHLARPHGRRKFLATLSGPEFMTGVLAVFADDFDVARPALERARSEAAERGDDASLPLVLRYLSFVELLTGDWGRARQLAEEAHDAALLTGQRSQQAILAGTNALIAAQRGERPTTGRWAEEALRLVDETGSGFADALARSALGLVELSLGDSGAAVGWLEPLRERIVTAGVREPGLARFVPDLVEARFLLGRSEEARALLAWYEEQAIRLNRTSALGASARCRALLAAAETDFEAAFTAIDEALTRYSQVAMPFERARTLLARGRIERRARRKRAAREALEEALSVFEKLRATAFAKQARLELARIGGRAPARGALTPTERRVAALVAEGRSTKEVATSLFVSPKTVEGHLSNIYAKLGIHSRAALARELSGTR